MTPAEQPWRPSWAVLGRSCLRDGWVARRPEEEPARPVDVERDEREET